MPHNLAYEKWYQRVWRPATSIVYLAIVIFDFVIMPIYVERTNAGVDYAAIDRVSMLEHQQTQVEVVRRLNLGDRTWAPLTLMGGGLFHLAFGAILTGAAVTRGIEKVKANQEEQNFARQPYQPIYVQQPVYGPGYHQQPGYPTEPISPTRGRGPSAHHDQVHSPRDPTE